jgi:hypothetical protein
MLTVPTKVSIKSGKLIETRDESSGADTVLYKDTVVKDKDKNKAKDLGSSRTAYFEYSSRCRYRE